MNKLEAVPALAEALTVRRIGEETVIITEAGEELHTLDDTGTFVWSEIDGKKTIGKILDLICAEYEVDRERAETDLFVFMAALLEKGVISLL